MALNLKHLRPEEIRARIPQLEAEAARFEELGALCLAELKRRDAAFYRKALGPAARCAAYRPAVARERAAVLP